MLPEDSDDENIDGSDDEVAVVARPSTGRGSRGGRMKTPGPGRGNGRRSRKVKLAEDFDDDEVDEADFPPEDDEDVKKKVVRRKYVNHASRGPH